MQRFYTKIHKNTYSFLKQNSNLHMYYSMLVILKISLYCYLIQQHALILEEPLWHLNWFIQVNFHSHGIDPLGFCFDIFSIL